MQSLTTDNKSFYTGATVWAVLLLIVGLGLLGYKSKPQNISAVAAPAAVSAQPTAKPIDPKREARERQEREAKFNAVKRGDISFCEAFKSDLQSFTGISKACLSDDPTYRAVRDGVRDALRR